MFDKVFKWAKLLSLFCVVPFTFYVCTLLNSLAKTSDQIAATTKALPQQVDDRIGKLQTDVMGKIDTVQDKLNTQVTSLATLSTDRIGNLSTTADNRIGNLEKDVFDAVKDLSGKVDKQLTTTNASITKLTDVYAGIPDVVGKRYEKDFASYFDCAKNRLCLQGQASDTMFAVRTTSRDTSAAMSTFATTLPVLSSNVTSISNTFATDIPKITDNFNGIAFNINRLTKPHWYDRVLGYALNGAILYRSLNPVTNLTLTGAQIVSSQK
jgi:methyl-accepting chemotaxis protein